MNTNEWVYRRLCRKRGGVCDSEGPTECSRRRCRRPITPQHAFHMSYYNNSACTEFISREQDAGQNQNLKKENKHFEIVAMFKYLVTILTNQNYMHE